MWLSGVVSTVDAHSHLLPLSANFATSRMALMLCK